MWLLRPDGVIDPLPVSESAYFSAAELERAHDFRGLQRLIGVGGLVAGGAVLVLLVVWPPRRAIARRGAARAKPPARRGRAGRGGRDARPCRSSPCRSARGPTSAPPTWACPRRTGEAGCPTARRPGPIAAALAAAGAALFSRPDAPVPAGLVAGGRRRRDRDRGRVRVARPGGRGPAVQPRTRTCRRAERGRRSPSSRSGPASTWATCSSWTPRGAPRPPTRTSAGLATRSGWSCTTRCSSEFDPAQVDLVVAHELAHVKQRDLARGMLWVAIVAAPGMYVVMLAHPALERAGRRVTGRARVRPRARARPGRRLVRPHRRLEPALAGGREPGRRLLARADRRAAPSSSSWSGVSRWRT